ncbi:AAA family ATPase [Acinetobacter sp. YH12021]|uniref:AAA family ATPase n=1 Tax=Acinetobacter sp. YH12021 TaxID=2601040 RepID=UPI0015D3F482|nr:AAA family ATPase [Acinetobacter sp. YH12021]
MKLEKFIITKLNGYQNVEIHIENNKKILVAENGSGKTTILNILFCCLTNNTSKLKGFIFEKAELIFSNGKVIKFYKDDLEQKYNENFDDIWDNYSRLKPSDYFLINEKLNSFFEFVNFILEYSGYIDVEKFIGFYVHTIFDVKSDYAKKRFIQNYIIKNLNFDAARMLIDIDKLILSKPDLYKRPLAKIIF